MSIADDIKILEGLIKDPNVRVGGKAKYKNKSYSLKQLTDLLADAKEQEKQEKNAAAEGQPVDRAEKRAAEETADALQKSIRMARGLVKNAQENLEIAIQRNGDVEGAQQDLLDRYKELQQLSPTDKLLEGVSLAPLASTEQQAGSARAREGDIEDVVPAEARKVVGVATVVENGNNVEVTTYDDKTVTKKILGEAPAGTEDTPANEVPKATVLPTDSADARKQYVDAQLKAQGLADTPANRKKLRQEYVPAKTAGDTGWEKIFRDAYPAKAWLLDLERTKYPQLFSLIQEYAKDRPLTAEEKVAFETKLDGTDFYKELAQSGKVREIKNIVGELGFDKTGTDFTKFVSDSINFGWTGDRLKQETYKEAFRRGADNQYVNPTAIKRVKASADYLNVVNDASAYFNRAGADERTVQSVLTGEIVREDFLRQQREIAKKRYSHLADLIDQGVSLESLSGSFKQTAAKLLELDPTTIDMSTGDFEVALNFGEEGKRRVMTSGEWEKLLRTDSRYGWEKTENAKTEARSLASSLAQAFGRII
jgi:hypothetical protein